MKIIIKLTETFYCVNNGYCLLGNTCYRLKLMNPQPPRCSAACALRHDILLYRIFMFNFFIKDKFDFITVKEWKKVV